MYKPIFLYILAVITNIITFFNILRIIIFVYDSIVYIVYTFWIMCNIQHYHQL